MESKLNVVLVQPGQPAVIKEIDGSLEGLQNVVGGLIQVVYPFDDPIGIVCNDEAKLVGMPLNRALYDRQGNIYDVIAGDFAVIGLTADDFRSLTVEEAEKYLDLYRVPEEILMRDGKIVVVPLNQNVLMTFEQFAKRIETSVKELLKAESIIVDTKQERVEKLQASYDGLIIQPKGDICGVTINLNEMYSHYCEGDSFQHIVDMTSECIKNGLKHRPQITIDQLSNYAWVKDHLAVEVINTEKNENLLQRIPHDTLADLAVVCRIHIDDRSDGSATALVTHDMLQTWKITEKQLISDALASSVEHYPLQITPMQNILGSISDDVCFDETPMLVCMTEGKTVNGAGVIAYPDFCVRVSEMIDGDFYVLPSSRHEVIAVPDSGCGYLELEEMVRSINSSSVVQPEDVLSDHVYHFDAVTKKLELGSEFAARLEKSLDETSRKTAFRAGR